MVARWAALAVIATVVNAAAPPRVPYLDWKACPFEGCHYGKWTAREQVTVYDSWKKGRKRIARLGADDRVTALTGLVITFRPGVIRMDRDLPEQNLKRGETILTYTYRGEGTSAAWVNGVFSPDFDISFARWPNGMGCGGIHCAATYLDLGEKVWWAEVEFGSGRRGWVNMNHAKFDGVDLLS